MSKIFIRIAAVILAAGLILAGCNNPAGGNTGSGGPDKTALAAAITAAEAAREGVVQAANAAGAPLNSEWVTPAEWNALDGVYTAAKAVNENADATQEAVTEATANLNAAIETFTTAKEAHDPGTGEAANLIITGLSAIYDTGDEIAVGLFNTNYGNLKENADGKGEKCTIGDDGSVTWDLGGKTGSYYVLFAADDGWFYFVSKQKIPFSGSLVNLTYPGDFTLWSHSLDPETLGFTPGGTVDEFCQYFAGGDYADWKTIAETEIKGRVNAKLQSKVDDNFAALYKNPERTQAFTGSDTLSSGEKIYTQYPIVEDRGEQIGEISGTITLNDIPTPRPRVEIYANSTQGGSELAWFSYANIDLRSITGDSGNVPWTIPLYENDLERGSWEDLSGTQTVYFSLDVWPSSGNGSFIIRLGDKELTIPDNKIISGVTFDTTASLAAVTLSGTVTLNLSGSGSASVDRVEISASAPESERGYVSLKGPINANTPWLIALPAFDTKKEISFMIEGRTAPQPHTSKGDKIFTTTATATEAVSVDENTTSISNISLSITPIKLITLSGTINVKYNDATVHEVRIEKSGGEGCSSKVTLANPNPGTSWSIIMQAPETEEQVNFNVSGWDLSGNELFSESEVLENPKLVEDDVSDITLNLGNITGD
jgi:hypothetical protein